MGYSISYYSEEIYEQIMNLPESLQAKYIGLTDRMMEHGPHLGLPHTDAFGGGLFELRIKGVEGIARVFFCMLIKKEIVIYLKDKRNSWWSRSKRFFALKQFFDTNHFDYVIDFRTKEYLLQEMIIHNFVFPKFIQTIHSFKIKSYVPKNKFLAKLLYRNCQQFISVSKGIQEKVNKNYNFLPVCFSYSSFFCSDFNIEGFHKDL